MGYAIFVDGKLRGTRQTAMSAIHCADRLWDAETYETIIVCDAYEDYEYITESEDWIYRIDKIEEE
jgi:hypothetical protein